jgi:hypothetical protein
MRIISQFISGAVMMGFIIIGYFFFRFWQKTRDGLFGVFAASFWVLAVERVLLLITASGLAAHSPFEEFRPYVYWVRFSAFMLIIIGIYLKNRRAE